MASASTAKAVIFCLICIGITVNSQCKWTVSGLIGGPDVTLDLSCARGRRLELVDSSQHDYYYAICQNGHNCDGVSVMVEQIVSNGGTEDCYNLATWDASVTPSYSGNSGGQWVFNYPTGDTDCGNPARTWVPTFVCDENIDFAFDSVSETYCTYYATIRTKYACTGNTECSQSANSILGDNKLSDGWIFIIVLFVAFVLYWIVGYAVMAKTVNKDGGFKDYKNNIPQRGFWIACPKLVAAGCAVSKEWTMGVIEKYKNRGSNVELAEAMASDEDSYQGANGHST